MTIRVVIADDQALVRGGFRLILEAQRDIEVVGEAADGREALDRIRELRRRVSEHVFVQVDGGLKHENVAAVHEAGADLIVVGSGIFEREDLPRAYLRLVRALA